MTTPTEYRSFALTEEEVDEINSGLSYVEQHYMIPGDEPQAIGYLDWNAGGNRWAAFTDDELNELHDHLISGHYSATDPGAPHMLGEILAELDRRKDTHDLV